MNATNTLTKIQDNLQRLLAEKSSALPEDFNQTRWLQNCMVVLLEVKNINEMNPQSVARTMLKGAFLNLDFFRRECYAIPYGNQLNFQTDYKGEIKLAKLYSIKPIADIYAKIVRKGDSLNAYIRAGKQFIDFNPLAFNNNEILGAFAVCLFTDKSMLYESMNIAELEDVKKHYAKKNQKGEYSPAWRNSIGEMYKKTVLRRLMKYIELNFTSKEQVLEYAESSEFDFQKEEAEWEPVKMPEVTEEPEDKPDQELPEEAGAPISPQTNMFDAKDERKENNDLKHWIPNITDRDVKRLQGRIAAMQEVLDKKYNFKVPMDFLKNFNVYSFSKSEITTPIYKEINDFLDSCMLEEGGE